MKHKAQIFAAIAGMVVILIGSTLMVTRSAQAMYRHQPAIVQQNGAGSVGSQSQPVANPAAVHLRLLPADTPLAQAAGEPQRTVSVSGSGQVQAQPDQATIRLGVQTDSDSAAQALTENSTKMQALLDSLKNAGVAADDIQTQAVQLQPQYNQPPGPQQTNQAPTGYRATNLVEVKVNNLDNLGQLLDAAVKAGGNTIQGISFDVSDPSALLDQAREAAMQDAKHKAEQLASLAGAQLGPVFNINENSSTPRPLMQAGIARADVAAVPIEPGTQSLEVNVQVTWLLQ